MFVCLFFLIFSYFPTGGGAGGAGGGMDMGKIMDMMNKMQGITLFKCVFVVVFLDHFSVFFLSELFSLQKNVFF